MPGEPTWELFARDTFVGADLADVNGRATDDASGHHWTVTKGNACIDGDRFRVTYPFPWKTVARIQMGLLVDRVDGKMLLDVPAGSNRTGMFGRMNAAGTTYYVAYLDAPWVYVFKVVDDIHYMLGRVSIAFQAPSQVHSLVIFADRIRILGATGGTLVEFTDSTISTTGYWGLVITAPDQFVDSVELYFAEGAATTASPTTSTPTTETPTTTGPEPTTAAPTTSPEPTFPPTTLEPTTAPPTTSAPTTLEPTTPAPTTAPPVTDEPVLLGSRIVAEFAYVSERDRVVCRAWVVDGDGRTRDVELDKDLCELRLIDELGIARSTTGSADPETGVVRFVVPQARLYSEHLYLARVVLDGVGPALFPLPVN